jgi:hypothetical protein
MIWNVPVDPGRGDWLALSGVEVKLIETCELHTTEINANKKMYKFFMLTFLLKLALKKPNTDFLNKRKASSTHLFSQLKIPERTGD